MKFSGSKPFGEPLSHAQSERAVSAFHDSVSRVHTSVLETIHQYNNLSVLTQYSELVNLATRQPERISFERPPADAPPEKQALYCLRTIQDRFANHLQTCSMMSRRLMSQTSNGESYNQSMFNDASELLYRLMEPDAFFGATYTPPHPTGVGKMAYALLDEFIGHVNDVYKTGAISAEEVKAFTDWKEQFAETFHSLEQKPIVLSTALSRLPTGNGQSR